MLEQAEDFRAESYALHELLKDIDPARFDEKTQFKDWTIDDVLQHLHFWNLMAYLALVDEAEFSSIMSGVLSNPGGLRSFETQYLEGLSALALLEHWRDLVDVTADHFAVTDPKKRLKWAGPDMSARSFITARLMETWAHGQAAYDHLGVERIDTDRIKNIAHLGVTTFGWSYVANGRQAPNDKPYVKLTGPSGAVWEWHTPSQTNFVAGDATAFCQVVTQTRNVAEAGLTVVGDTAREWLSIAQCFAGPPEAPPAPGTRFMRR